MSVHRIFMKLLYNSFAYYINLYNVEHIHNEYWLMHEMDLHDTMQDKNVTAQLNNTRENETFPLLELNEISIKHYMSIFKFVREFVYLYLKAKKDGTLNYDPFENIMLRLKGSLDASDSQHKIY